MSVVSQRAPRRPLCLAVPDRMQSLRKLSTFAPREVR